MTEGLEELEFSWMPDGSYKSVPAPYDGHFKIVWRDCFGGQPIHLCDRALSYGDVIKVSGLAEPIITLVATIADLQPRPSSKSS